MKNLFSLLRQCQTIFQQISTDILAHWMDLINVEGWIPREQILGLEARAKVVAKAEVCESLRVCQLILHK